MIGLTVVVPALNESTKVIDTIDQLIPMLRETGLDFDVLMINDGSSDDTGAIMDELSQTYPECSVIHNDAPHGLGAALLTGLDYTQMSNIVIIPGDNAYEANQLMALFGCVGTVDFPVGYRDNQSEARPAYRAFLSVVFSFLTNLLFRHRLRDIHGVPIYPTQHMKDLNLTLDGYSFQIKAVVKLLRKHPDLTIKEVPVYLIKNPLDNSQALTMRTLKSVSRAVWALIVSD